MLIARRLLPEGYKLDNGKLELLLASLDDNGIVANLTLNANGVDYSCNIFIPGARDFILSEPLATH